jgi:hypothetical protein
VICFDGCVALGITAHGYKREAAGAASRAIGHQGDVRDGAMLAEKVFEIVFSSIEG